MITEVKVFDAKEYIQSLIEKEKTKKRLGLVALKSKKELIKESYNEIFEHYQNKRDHHYSCTCSLCGEEMVYISKEGDYAFWGCPNYKDDKRGKHDSFSGEYHYSDNFEMKPSLWLNNIKSLCDLENISVSALYEFITLHLKLSDIRLSLTDKYTVINDLANVKTRAKKQEDLFNDKSKNYFTKIVSQFGMQIKTSESKRAKRRIADFVASNDKGVFYIEIKNSINDFNSDQFHETFEGIEYIMRSTGDERPIFGCFYYFETPIFEINENIIENLINNSIREGLYND